MKIAFLVLVSMFLSAGWLPAQTVKPTPTPVSKSHRHKHRPEVRHPDSDEDTSAKASPTPSRKTVHKKVHSDVETEEHAESSPGPSSKQKAHKKPGDSGTTDEDATPVPSASLQPTPHASPKKRIHKKAVDDETEPQEGPSSTPSPEPMATTQAPKAGSANSAPDASLTSDQLTEFDKQPPRVQKLIESALALTSQNLTYIYGSADPQNGGMDCSGFVYYVLRQNGIVDVPRDASGQYVWVRKAKTFQAVLSKRADSFELDDLRPGDLLFWTGTYASQKDPPVTHTMIYLGREKATQKGVMVGSTDGRSYQGKSRWGVSVFDFNADAGPSQTDAAKQTHAAFVGYAHIPKLGGE